MLKDGVPTSATGCLSTFNFHLSTQSCHRHDCPMPSIYETLRADIVTAMKARDSATTLALRTADAAIKRAEMDTGKPLDDALVLTTLKKAVKNLTDAKAEFAK